MPTQLSFLIYMCIYATTIGAIPDWLNAFTNDTDRLYRHMTNGSGAGEAYRWLANITDTFGNRHVGSKALEDAIDFIVARLIADGFQNVHTEDVPDLPNWIRGADVVELIEPRHHILNILAIDGSPSANITADAIVIKTIEELRTANVRDKIVILVEQWQGYGTTVAARGAGSIAAQFGAVALLIRSVTPYSLYTPHTGAGDRGVSIPAACLTIEEAQMLMRMNERGQKIRIHLQFSSHENGTVTSRNTIFDLTGWDKPNEIVLMSGHFDSWDVGQGAMDDGGGCAISWHALYTLKQLGNQLYLYWQFAFSGMKPRRTIRVVLWTAEEQGDLGSQYYYKMHANKTDEQFFFVSESDMGAFRPQNWNSMFFFNGSPTQRTQMKEIVSNLINSYGIPLNVSDTDSGQGDVRPWAMNGVPAVNYIPDRGQEYYFRYHHTNADYMTVFEPGDLEYVAFMFATTLNVIANMDCWCNHQQEITTTTATSDTTATTTTTTSNTTGTTPNSSPVSIVTNGMISKVVLLSIAVCFIRSRLNSN